MVRWVGGVMMMVMVSGRCARIALRSIRVKPEEVEGRIVSAPGKTAQTCSFLFRLVVVMVVATITISMRVGTIRSAGPTDESAAHGGDDDVPDGCSWPAYCFARRWFRECRVLHPRRCRACYRRSSVVVVLGESPHVPF